MAGTKVYPGDTLLEDIIVTFDCEGCKAYNDPTAPKGMVMPRFFYCWFCGKQRGFACFTSEEGEVNSLHLVDSET